ncbi:MAG: GPP34 family phosphoprotein [Pseudomonadota bacterium]
MDTTLPQAILLLSLNDKTGKTEDGYYQPALAGADIADLLLHRAIEFQAEDGTLVPLRHKRSMGAFLDQCDGVIGAASKAREITYWISELANQRDVIATIADELCHLGALSKEKTTMFGLFSRTVWPEASPVLESTLKAEMAAAMFEGNDPIEERLCLAIGLSKSVDLLKHNFDPDLLSQHQARIDSICKGDCLHSDATEAVVQAVQAAIEAANAAADSVIAGIID